jgi:hypothetical protein
MATHIMKTQNNDFKVVINYFDKTELISTAQEAINFINKLSYRGNSHSITCNDHTQKLLIDLFNGENLPQYGKPFQSYYSVATTGCGNTNINLYLALADTLEKHNEIVLLQKKSKEAEEDEKRKQRNQEYLDMMYEPMKGWYVVTVTGLASKERGNDGKVTKSVRILAENRMDAFNKAVTFLEENPPKNVIFWYSFESSKSALIEYVGVWTDEAEIEFN